MLDTTYGARAPDDQSAAYRWVVDEAKNPPGLVAVPVVPRNTFFPPTDAERQIVRVRPSIKGIAHDVARRRGLTVADIFIGGRTRPMVHARQEVMWEGRQAGWSFPMIARRFPSEKSSRRHMDHTSVIHGVRQHAKRRRLALMGAIRADNAASALTHGGRA